MRDQKPSLSQPQDGAAAAHPQFDACSQPQSPPRANLARRRAKKPSFSQPQPESQLLHPPQLLLPPQLLHEALETIGAAVAAGAAAAASPPASHAEVTSRNAAFTSENLRWRMTSAKGRRSEAYRRSAPARTTTCAFPDPVSLRNQRPAHSSRMIGSLIRTHFIGRPHSPPLAAFPKTARRLVFPCLVGPPKRRKRSRGKFYLTWLFG